MSRITNVIRVDVAKHLTAECYQKKLPIPVDLATKINAKLEKVHV